MKKIQLCIIADSIDTQYAGIFTYASELIPALERLKPEHVEITYLHQRKNAFFDGRKQLIVPSHRRYPGADTVRRMLRIPALLRSEGFDIVHDLGHIAPFPWKSEPYKKVLTVHDLTPILMPELHVKRSQLIHRLLFPRLVAHADHLITVSETTKTDVIRLLAPKCPVTATLLASKPLIYSEEPPITTSYILCVSTLEPRKNIALLVHAFEKLKESGSRHTLVLVGKEGWHVESLLQQINASPWRKDIMLTGFIPDAELGSWYAHADLVVYPSIYEGFGLPMLEAMQAGVPLLVHKTPAALEVAADGAHVFSMTVESLHTDMKQYLGDKQMAGELAAKGQARARTFTWERTAQKTWEVYRSLSR